MRARPAHNAPSIGVRLIDVPRRSADDPRARLYIVDRVAPGTTIRRRIEVSAVGAPAHIVVYPDAATIAGGSFLGADGHTANDLTRWTSAFPRTVDLPDARTAVSDRREVTITIAVPVDATSGERYGVVWAETRTVPGTPANGNVSQVSRVGIRVYLSVGVGGAPAANFTIESFTAERSADRRPVVVATVHNTGGQALDINGSLRLSHGPAGLGAGPFPATLGTTLALGDTEPVTINLDPRLPPGPWAADITLRSGLVERRARATITFPDVGASAPVHASAPRVASLRYPAIAGAVLALAAIAIAGGRRHIRNRRVLELHRLVRRATR